MTAVGCVIGGMGLARLAGAGCGWICTVSSVDAVQWDIVSEHAKYYVLYYLSKAGLARTAFRLCRYDGTSGLLVT